MRGIYSETESIEGHVPLGIHYEFSQSNNAVKMEHQLLR